nr:CGNR zinc finger domain-containing protein [Tamaricihabitans halophyticus]
MPADETLAARALLAWATINERAPGRLRPCANSECCRFLLDRSRANTAQWCSMAICGNRFKARRHYRRTRSASD